MALKILLADDSMTAQNMGKKILSDAGYEVLTVSNGAAAVKKLAELTPDIAVLDVYMPGYSGLEVCERMKVTPATARVPVLLTVGKMEPFRPEDGMKAKADGVIIKPFEATDLVTVIEKLALRTYGFTPAKPSPEQPPAPPPVAAPFDDEPLVAAVHEQAVDEAPESAPKCIVDEDSEPVFAAAGLQTFEQLDVVASVAQEPHIEFTAAPQVEVATERIAGLETTVLQDVIPAENATEDTLVSFGGDGQPDTGKLGLGAGAFEAYGALTGMVDEPGAEPVWEAVAEPVDLDAVDLEAEMRKAQGQSQAAVAEEFAAVLAPGEDDFEPRAMAAGAATGAPAQLHEPGVPLLAPIGKTSLDEFDSIMAETASKFEASSASAVEVEELQPQGGGAAQDSEPLAQIPTIPEQVPEFELEPSREEIAESAESAMDFSVHDTAFEPTSEQQDMVVSDGGSLLAELISEEREEPVFTPMPATMRGSDALNGVFDLDGPKAVEEALPEGEVSSALPEAGAAEAQEAEPAGPALGPEQVAVAEEEEPVWATIVPERVSKDLLLHQAAGPADTAADTQAANSIRVEEPEGVTSSEPVVAVHQPVIALDEATMNTLVERVVDRVLERLKPILVVTVEEILREFKR